MLYMDNAKECFASAVTVPDFAGDKTEEHFYHKFAGMIPDTIDVDTLVLAFKMAFKDEKNISMFISLVPRYVRQCSSKEFAHEFRMKYNRQVLGLTQEDLPEDDYGYNEVEENVIDISNKDEAEVLAALYNASTPVGMGFYQYNPRTWDKEIAQLYIDKMVEKDHDGSMTFGYVLGRPLKFSIRNNLAYVAKYNYENEEGLAQRAIATCPNKGISYKNTKKKNS